MTDALSSFYHGDCTVVRFNGGAQAGHTVVTPDGQRHIFSHFGSGTFAGAQTFLSAFFIMNPLLMMREYAQIKEFISLPIFVSPFALVTTPYDMMINHLFEKKRGFKSSCGVGINETVSHCAYSQFRLTASDLGHISNLKDYLQLIKKSWIPHRLKKLEITPTKQECEELFENNALIRQWLEDCEKSFQLIKLKKTVPGNLIYEGAQGLMLDEDYGKFPYVTRSRTGMKNVLNMRNLIDYEDKMEVIYVTRAYATRHGAGPLPNETTGKPYPRVVDETNITNEYQGSLRFGYLDVDTLQKAIEFDFKKAKYLNPQLTLAVTCLDQLDEVTFTSDGETHTTSIDRFLETIQTKTGAGKIITSYGPTRKTLANFQMALR